MERVRDRMERVEERAGGPAGGRAGGKETGPPAAVVDEKDFLSFPAVDHRPAACPNCGSHNSHVYTVKHQTAKTILRYHRCNERRCGVKFRSLEELDPRVVVFAARGAEVKSDG